MSGYCTRELVIEAVEQLAGLAERADAGAAGEGGEVLGFEEGAGRSSTAWR